MTAMVPMPDTLKVGAALLADRAYDAEALRREIAEVDGPISRPCRSGVTGGPSTHCFTAIATRYDKRDDNFLASIRIWLRLKAFPFIHDAYPAA